MIDKKTGELIIFPEGIKISPAIGEEEFEALPFSKKVDKRQIQHNEKLYHANYYQFKAYDSAGNCFDIKVNFSDYPAPPPWNYAPSKTELWWITLNYMGLPDFADPKDWTSLNVKKAWHDQWLQGILGVAPQATYEWGEVSSQYELKSDTVFIGINYIKTKWRNAH